MQTVYYLILIPMVYLAFTIFIVGTAVRLKKIFSAPPNPTTLQIFPQENQGRLGLLVDAFTLPTVRHHKPLQWFFLMLFHAAFLLILIGHIELLNHFWILQLIPHEIFIGHGSLGLFMCISLLYFLFRRFVSPYRDLSVPEDYYLLILLFLTVLFGSEMDWARSWYGYGELNVADYRTYLWSLLTLDPELPANLMFSGHSFMLVLHVFFANLFLMFFPFSKIMHSFFSLPMNRLRRG